MKKQTTPGNKGKRYPAKEAVLTPDEVSRLLKTCNRRCSTGIRNRALIVLLTHTGLRLAEALSLRPVDVNHDCGTVDVLHGKNDRARTVGIPDAALAYVQLWLDRRKQLKIGRGAPLFCTLKGGPIWQSYIRELLPRLARKAGIEKRVHAHGLRHSFSNELHGQGVALSSIQSALGHSRPSMTDRYLSTLNPVRAIADVRSANCQLPPPG